MEIGSATSNLYATINTQTAQARARQSEQEQTTQAAAPQAQPEPASQAQAPETVIEASAAAQSEAERNRPVVNTSGQLVGTRVNTTA